MRLLWLAEGEARAAVRGIFMLLGEKPAAKFRFEVPQCFLGSRQLKKRPTSSLAGRGHR